MLAQVADSVGDTAGMQPTAKRADLFSDDGLHTFHFLHTQANTFTDTSLQVVQSVEVHIWLPGNGRVDIARKGNVYKKQRAAMTLLHDLLHDFDGDKGMRGRGGRDDHICLR